MFGVFPNRVERCTLDLVLKLPSSHFLAVILKGTRVLSTHGNKIKNETFFQ